MLSMMLQEKWRESGSGLMGMIDDWLEKKDMET